MFFSMPEIEPHKENVAPVLFCKGLCCQRKLITWDIITEFC